MAGMTFDEFMDPNFPHTVRPFPLTDDLDVVKGQVVALVAGAVVSYDSTESDGSETPIGVVFETPELAADADSRNVYLLTTGKVNENSLVFSQAGDEVDDAFYILMRDMGIIIENW